MRNFQRPTHCNLPKEFGRKILSDLDQKTKVCVLRRVDVTIDMVLGVLLRPRRHVGPSLVG